MYVCTCVWLCMYVNTVYGFCMDRGSHMVQSANVYVCMVVYVCKHSVWILHGQR